MWRIGFIALAAAPFGFAAPVTAQDALPACQSQQELEQVIGSDGDFIPDGCRNLTVTKIDADEETLCVIDFAGEDDGVLQALRDAAAPEQWWVRCEALGEAAR